MAWSSAGEGIARWRHGVAVLGRSGVGLGVALRQRGAGGGSATVLWGRGGSVVVRGGGARSQWRSRWQCLTAAAEHTSRRSSGDNGGEGVVAGCGKGWGRWWRRDTSATATMMTRLLRLLQGRSGIRRLHRRRWRRRGGSASETRGRTTRPGLAAVKGDGGPRQRWLHVQARRRRPSVALGG